MLLSSGFISFGGNANIGIHLSRFLNGFRFVCSVYGRSCLEQQELSQLFNLLARCGLKMTCRRIYLQDILYVVALLKTCTKMVKNSNSSTFSYSYTIKVQDKMNES